MKSKILLTAVALSGTSCSLSYPYKHYPWDYKNQLLLGSKEDGSEDLQEILCDNSDGVTKCVVQFLSEYEKEKSENLDLKRKLIECQKSKK